MEVRFLLESGVPSPAGHLLSNFYNRTRPEYYRRLKEASMSPDGVVAFIAYAVNGFIEELRQQIKFVKRQQWAVSWENYVFEMFEGHHTVSDKRQRDLALALSKVKAPVHRSHIKLLSPEIAVQYAKKTNKTLSRDLNALVEKGLLVRTKDGYRATVEKILAFLPTAKKESIAKQMQDVGFAPEEAADQLELRDPDLLDFLPSVTED
jgi:Fic family protein